MPQHIGSWLVLVVASTAILSAAAKGFGSDEKCEWNTDDIILYA